MIVIDGLNHMFQPAISEYFTLDEPFEDDNITLIADWIDANT